MRGVLGCMVLLGGLRAAAADPAELARSKVAAGMARIQTQMKSCRVRRPAGGWVKLTVEVNADGAVTSVTPESDDASLGACVADIVKTATFGRTPGGGTFTYPLVFREGDIPIDTSSGPARVVGLDAAAITAKIDPALPKLAACASKVPVGGTIRLQVKVSPSGKVVSTNTSAGDAKLGECVATIVKTIAFPATKAGGSFTHPFTFTVPPARQRDAIDTAVGKVQDRLDQCATTSGVSVSNMEVALDVRANGTVTKAMFSDTVSPNFAKCLSTALMKARLPSVAGDATLPYSISVHAAVAKRPPDALERALLPAHDDLDACGSKYDYSGTVDVTLTVRPNGMISAVKLGDSTPAKIASCLSVALAKRTLGPARADETIAVKLSIPYGQRPRDQATLTSAIGTARESLDACGTTHSFKGSLALALTVRAEGTLSSVRLPEGTKPELAKCVQDALQRVTLPRASSASEETITITIPASP